MDQPLVEDRVNENPGVVRVHHRHVGAGSPVVPVEPIVCASGLAALDNVNPFLRLPLLFLSYPCLHLNDQSLET